MRSFLRLPYYLLSLALIAQLGCNGDDGSTDDEIGNEDPSGDDDPLDTSTGDGDGDTTTETTETETTETETTETETAETETTETETTETTETETTETGDPPDDSMYSAVIMPGGLDRVVVTRVNEGEDTCARMVLVSPQNFDEFDIATPQNWAVESVSSWAGLDCNDGQADYIALLGEGEITFDGYDALGTYPCALSFDVTFTMSTDPYTDMLFQADGVTVSGVNCG